MLFVSIILLLEFVLEVNIRYHSNTSLLNTILVNGCDDQCHNIYLVSMIKVKGRFC